MPEPWASKELLQTSSQSELELRLRVNLDTSRRRTLQAGGMEVGMSKKLRVKNSKLGTPG